MKTHVRPSTGVITVEIDTPQGSRKVSTGTSDPELAQQIIEAAKLREIEVLSKAGALTQALVQKLVIGGNMTVGQAVNEYKEWISQTANSARTENAYATELECWVKWGKFKNTPLCKIQERHIGQYINDQDATRKANTRGTKLTCIKALFRFCLAKSYVFPDPSALVTVKVRELALELKEPKKVHLYTEKQFQKLEDYLTMQIVELSDEEELSPSRERRLGRMRFWYCAILLGRYSGLRLSDICTLEKSSATQVPGKLVIWTRKRHVRVEIPVDENVQRALNSIPNTHGKMFFPAQDEMARHPVKRAQLSVQFSRIAEECGIPEHTFHGLRHTLATELGVKNGKSLEEIATALGHRNTGTTKGYVHST